MDIPDEVIERAAWVLIECDTDTADRGVSEEHYRERLAEVRLAAPVIAEWALKEALQEHRDIIAAGFEHLERLFLSMRDRVAGYSDAPPAPRLFTEGPAAFEWAAQNVRRIAIGESPLKPPVPLRPLREDDRQEDGWKHYVLTCETCGERFVCSAQVPVEHRVWDDDQSVRHYGTPPEVAEVKS